MQGNYGKALEEILADGHVAPVGIEVQGRWLCVFASHDFVCVQ